MACGKCAKKAAARAAARAAAAAETLLSEPRWLVRVDGFEGDFTASDGMRYPLGSGAFYPLLNSDVNQLLSSGVSVSFPNEVIATEFKTHNHLV